MHDGCNNRLWFAFINVVALLMDCSFLLCLICAKCICMDIINKKQLRNKDVNGDMKPLNVHHGFFVSILLRSVSVRHGFFVSILLESVSVHHCFFVNILLESVSVHHGFFVRTLFESVVERTLVIVVYAMKWVHATKRQNVQTCKSHIIVTEIVVCSSGMF
jgi:hypothetical protein